MFLLFRVDFRIIEKKEGGGMSERKDRYSVSTVIGDAKFSAAWGRFGRQSRAQDSLLLLHAHGEYEIFFVQSGALYIHAADGVYSFEKGSVVVLPPDYLHYASFDDAFAFVFSFERKHGAGQEKYFERFCDFFTPSAVLSFGNAKAYEYLLEELSDCFREEKAGDEYRAKAVLQLVFLRLLNTRGATGQARGGADTGTSPYVYDIANLVARNYTERLTIKDVAKSLFLSERQVSRIVRKHFHTTFPRLLNDRRLAIAAAMLQGTDKSVGEIRLAVGFETESGFFTAFKKRYGVTPLRYRKEKKILPNG